MLTPYPQIVEYNEAVQHPATAFSDPELRQGRVATNALGLPVALSGGFALTYVMTTARRKLALRCFHRDITAGEHKYAAIVRALEALHSPYFVPFDYLPDGIRIRGGFYPILKMQWAEGDPLGIWLARNAGDRRAVARLREAFAALAAFLEDGGVAHGDIQNGNVIVAPGAELTLVDYDGMFVPGMPREFGCESGHKHFQHPRRSAANFGPAMDRFSFIVVDLSLAALIEDPALYRRFSQDGETIVFRAGDFAAPERSEVFSLLVRRPALVREVRDLAAICRAEFSAVPTLADFRAGRHIPRDAAPAGPRPAAAAPPASRGATNRQIVARLARRPARTPASVTQTAPAAAAPPATRRPGRANQAIVRALRRRTTAPAASTPRPSATAAGAVAVPHQSSRPTLPRSGSVVIHPRNRVPRPVSSPDPAPRLTLWARIRRVLGLA